MRGKENKDMVKIFRDFDEIVANAEPTDFFDNVRKTVKKNQGLIDEHALRHGQDWSKIANQVVGAEAPNSEK